ncbi:MAG: hypothetical protein FWD88_08085 [Treponema sp.]|nr:hypothetical protein [Treponema sp.]
MDSQNPENTGQTPDGWPTEQQPQYTQPPPQWAPVPPQPPAGNQPGNGLAVGSLVCGIIAIIAIIVPLVGLILGIVGIVLAANARKQGFVGGLATGGLVCSIIGTAGNALSTCICIPIACAAIAAASDPFGANFWGMW